jgi:CRP-like cAMP-binding protein
MSEIEVVKASKAGKRHRLFDKVVSGSGSGLPSAFLLEDSQKLAKRAILSVRRGPIRYHRNSSIVCEGDPADYVFMVVDGIVRRCKTFQNGARAIVAFHTPGELFGWTDELKHALSIEAATEERFDFGRGARTKGCGFLVDLNNRRTATHPRALAADQPQCKMQGCKLLARSFGAN